MLFSTELSSFYVDLFLLNIFTNFCNNTIKKIFIETVHAPHVDTGFVR